MSSSDLTSSLLDISESLTTNILAEDENPKNITDTKSITASRELLNTKRKSRDEDEIIAQDEYIPLIRAPRKRLRAIAPTSMQSQDSLLSSITSGGAVFSINDTSFHNANKNAKTMSKAQRKKNAKGSNYSDKLNTKISSKKERSKKQQKSK